MSSTTTTLPVTIDPMLADYFHKRRIECDEYMSKLTTPFEPGKSVKNALMELIFTINSQGRPVKHILMTGAVFLEHLPDKSHKYHVRTFSHLTQIVSFFVLDH